MNWSLAAESVESTVVDFSYNLAAKIQKFSISQEKISISIIFNFQFMIFNYVWGQGALGLAGCLLVSASLSYPALRAPLPEEGEACHRMIVEDVVPVLLSLGATSMSLPYFNC